jgi:hypothetical protein
MKIIKGRLSKVIDINNQGLTSNKSKPEILMIVPEVRYPEKKLEVYTKRKSPKYKKNKNKNKSSSTVLTISPKEVDLKFYNPPIQADVFDVESYVPIPVVPSLKQLRFRIAANQWRSQISTISKIRSGKIPTVKHCTSLSQEEMLTEYNIPIRLGAHPLYLTNFPLAPKFSKPCTDTAAVHIYVLVDPADSTVRYVGSTIDPLEEYTKLKDYKVYNKKLYKWQKSIDSKFKFEVITNVFEHEANQAEKAWVKYYRGIGEIYNHKNK